MKYVHCTENLVKSSEESPNLCIINSMMVASLALDTKKLHKTLYLNIKKRIEKKNLAKVQITLQCA